MTVRISERQVQASIVQLLKTLGARVWVLGTVRRVGDYAGTMQTPGIPDLLAFLPPRPCPPHCSGEACPKPYRQLWIEVKADGGRLRPQQTFFRDSCELAGVEHITGDLDAVLRYLRAAGYVKAVA